MLLFAQTLRVHALFTARYVAEREIAVECTPDICLQFADFAGLFFFAK
jgi:hypothetical protein